MNIIIPKNKFLGIGLLVSVVFIVSFSLLFSFNSRYNQNKAEAQEITECEEIPIGEAMEQTSQLIGDLVDEINKINYATYDEVDAALNIISLAQQCDIGNCQPVCDKSSYQYTWEEEECFENEEGEEECRMVEHTETRWRCEPQPCEGQPCPNDQIEQEFKRTESTFDQVKGTTARTQAIIGQKGEIEEKLNESRLIFDNCALSPHDWLKVDRGEKEPRYSLSCDTVIREDLPRKEEECKSWLNFFCCQ